MDNPTYLHEPSEELRRHCGIVDGERDLSGVLALSETELENRILGDAVSEGVLRLTRTQAQIACSFAKCGPNEFIIGVRHQAHPRYESFVAAKAVENGEP